LLNEPVRCIDQVLRLVLLLRRVAQLLGEELRQRHPGARGAVGRCGAGAPPPQRRRIAAAHS